MTKSIEILIDKEFLQYLATALVIVSVETLMSTDCFFKQGGVQCVLTEESFYGELRAQVVR